MVPRPAGEPDHGRIDVGRSRRARRVRGRRRVQRPRSSRGSTLGAQRRPVGTHPRGRGPQHGRGTDRSPPSALCAHTVEVGDAFEVMAKLAREDRRFGVVIVDPPSFAQRQSSIDTAVRAYTRLTHLAVRLVEPGGTLVQASCSSRVTPERVLRHGRDRRVGRRATPDERAPHRSRHGPPGRFPAGRVPQGGILVGAPESDDASRRSRRPITTIR